MNILNINFSHYQGFLINTVALCMKNADKMYNQSKEPMLLGTTKSCKRFY